MHARVDRVEGGARIHPAIRAFTPPPLQRGGARVERVVREGHVLRGVEMRGRGAVSASKRRPLQRLLHPFLAFPARRVSACSVGSRVWNLGSGITVQC